MSSLRTSAALVFAFALLACGGSNSDDNGGDGNSSADGGTGPDAASVDAPDEGPVAVVVFSRTLGYRHAAIPLGIALVEELGATAGWTVSATEDSAVLIDNLATTDVVVFCNTTGDVLDDEQQVAFEAFIRGGGGYVGIHSATDTEYLWPWYAELAGTRFANHPAPQLATVNVEATDHPITAGLAATISISDEWYNFVSNPRASVTVLATLDEASYNGGEMGSDHPIMWSQQIDSGRSFYTGLGHRDQTYADDSFRASIANAIEWAASRID